jgi:hypothetical protein
VELVDRVHLDPACRDFEVTEQPARDGVRVAQEGIEVSGRIEDIAIAPERAAVTSGDVVLLDDQDLQPGLREQIAAHQAAESGADDHGVVTGFGWRSAPEVRKLPGVVVQ